MDSRAECQPRAPNEDAIFLNKNSILVSNGACWFVHTDPDDNSPNSCISDVSYIRLMASADSGRAIVIEGVTRPSGWKAAFDEAAGEVRLIVYRNRKRVATIQWEPFWALSADGSRLATFMDGLVKEYVLPTM